MELYSCFILLLRSLGNIVVLHNEDRYARFFSINGFLVSTPLWLVLLGSNRAYIMASSFLAILTIIRHHANIKRLLTGTEHKVGERVA